jgi:hypothetical protein
MGNKIKLVNNWLHSDREDGELTIVEKALNRVKNGIHCYLDFNETTSYDITIEGWGYAKDFIGCDSAGTHAVFNKIYFPNFKNLVLKNPKFAEYLRIEEKHIKNNIEDRSSDIKSDKELIEKMNKDIEDFKKDIKVLEKYIEEKKETIKRAEGKIKYNKSKASASKGKLTKLKSKKHSVSY